MRPSPTGISRRSVRMSTGPSLPAAERADHSTRRAALSLSDGVSKTRALAYSGLRARRSALGEPESRNARGQRLLRRVRGAAAAGLPRAGDEVPLRAPGLRRQPGALALRGRALGAAPSGDLLVGDG